MMKRSILHRLAMVLGILVMVVPQTVGLAAAKTPTAASLGPARSTTTPPDPEAPPHKLSNKQQANGVDTGGDDPFARAEWFYGMRIAGKDPLTVAEAAAKRAQAASNLLAQKGQGPSAPSQPSTYGGAWAPLGPNPILQIDRTPAQNAYAVTGRIGALAIASTAPFTIYLGGAQGGIWISSTLTSSWTAKTDQLGSLAIGAIALAPNHENVVYVGTGEGALSGDSYFGNGVLKSVDGGQTFTQVSGSTFNQVSISKIVVDPGDPNIVYAATLAGVAGTVDVRANAATPYGIWKSTDGGVHWTGLITTTDRLHGATDLVMDPQNSTNLYASFWGQGISKTVDSGTNWTSIMNGFPVTATFGTAPGSRFALGISHPGADPNPTLYTGFDWYDSGIATAAHYHHSTIWKSTNKGTTWTQTPDLGTYPDQVNGYCDKTSAGSQCTYDNEIGVDPNNANIVYALGLFNYNTGSGGIYRSTDGGNHWVDIGYGLHPDYHAIAIRHDDPTHIVIGNDGGVWSSPDRGGRPAGASDPVSDVDWTDLNGGFNPATAALLYRTGLQISEFTGIGQNPTVTGRIYGGLQDNGTLRKSSSSTTWADLASGDGGHVLVDPTDPNFVYGTYPGLAPYRFMDGMANFFTNQFILSGIDQNDRSAFYIPWIMDPGNPNRLYLGSDRIYRTDNAKADNAGEVTWQAISPDLTSGCSSRNTSPTSFACVVTAIGTTSGGQFVYAGTGDGRVWLSTNATSGAPSWTEVDVPSGSLPLPLRPIAAFAVDSSNYRIAYVAYSGFNGATPFTPGHVFKTSDGGQHWTDISSNLPDVPLNTIVVDPSDPQTLYVGSDVGPLVTHNLGGSWAPLGTDFPIVTVAQLDVNPYTRQLRAGTYGRGAWGLDDSATAISALRIAGADTGVPVGPGSLLTYRVTVENHGNITATNVVVTGVVPVNTTFVSAGSGGSQAGGVVHWTIPSIPMPTQVPTDGPLGSVGLAPGASTVTFTVQIATGAGLTTGSAITLDGLAAKASDGASASGSPHTVTIAAPFAITVTPASQQDYARPGQTITYTVGVHNLGFTPDAYSLATSGNAWPTTLWDGSFATPITQTTTVTPGSTYTVGVKVTVPLAATSGLTDTVTIKATSRTTPTVSASASIQTIAVTNFILLVDEDGSAASNPIPDVSGIYAAALNSTGLGHDTWDLAAHPALGLNYMKAHRAIVWFTGTSYPAPLGPYERALAAYLDSGGRLFLSGMDILDQSAGTTPFVHDYLHVDWDGTDAQNDVGTASVTGVISNPVTSGLGTIPLNFASLGYLDFADAITPISPAIPAFTLNPSLGGNSPAGTPDALSVDTGTYKVVFLAFPFEVMGTPGDRVIVMKRVIAYFGLQRMFLPIIVR